MQCACPYSLSPLRWLLTPVCPPLSSLCFTQVSHVVVSTLDALWLAPKGLRDVHNMLRNVARSLVAGGRTGVFSPMHMLVFQKPVDA